MLHSMTGFGKAVFELHGKNVTIEIKTLNSKQIDINVKLPQKYKDKELIIRNELSRQLVRGKIDLILNEENTATDRPAIVNQTVIEAYYRKFKEIHDKLGLPTTECVMQIIMRLPDTLIIEEEKPDEADWGIIFENLKNAVGEVLKYRSLEGRVLEQDVSMRIENIVNFSGEIELYEKSRLENIKSRISSNVIEYVGDQAFDKNRFEQELIYYIEKLDITEEKVRLANHCKYFAETVKMESSAGKKLGFISQEIGREINTIGSKAYDSEIQIIVVRMKDELEKIKEQLLNVL